MKKIHGAGTAAAKGQKTAGSEASRKHSSGRRLLCVLLMGAVLAGCAGPSTRVIVRSETGSNHELPEEIPVLEEVNPYYIQESLTVLSETSRYGGSRGERDAVKYIQQLLGDYGYQVEIQRFRYETEFGVRTGTNVEAVREASSRDSDILVICSNHDTAKESPGANNNGSGTAAFLETARLLSRIPTDTELRFVSFAQCGRERLGARHYVESLRKRERERIVGVVELDQMGHVSDDEMVLGTVDGGSVYTGDLLRTVSRKVLGDSWPYVCRTEGSIGAFVRDEIPAVSISQKWNGYENGTPLDLTETVDVEQVAQTVDVICGMALEMMSTDTPSMMAKAHSYNDRDYAFVQKKDTPAWFGESPEFVQTETGRTGILNGINTDASGRQVEKYQFRMKWFDVDQIILTDYYFTDGGLSLISLEGEEAGIEFDDMKERITELYGEPIGENSGPNGTEYDWTDPVYHKFFALIPETEGYDLEIREYWTDKTVYEQRSPKGQILASEKEDPRCDVLSDLIFDILPEDGDEIIESVSYYTDGIGGSAGYVEYGNENADGTSMSGIDGEGGQENSRFYWRMSVDLEDALDRTGNWRNRTETIRMFTGLYGEILEQSAILKQEDGSEQETYGAAFAARFPEAEEEPIPEAKKQPQAPVTRVGVAPGEAGEEAAPPDFKTAFQMYVLAERSEKAPESWSSRIDFFRQFEELEAYRSRVRTNLNMPSEVGAYAGED